MLILINNSYGNAKANFEIFFKSVYITLCVVAIVDHVFNLSQRRFIHVLQCVFCSPGNSLSIIESFIGVR